MRRRSLPLASLLAFVAAVTPARPLCAQTVSLTPGVLAFAAPGPADFLAGWIDHPPVTVSIKPGTGGGGRWELRIRAADPDLGGYGKPVADLLWRVEGAAAWTPLATSDQTVQSGQGKKDVVIHFRIRLDWTFDAPDSYAVTLVFTASPA